MVVEYATLKSVHVTCAGLSYAGFFIRGVWMIRESPLRRTRTARSLPHVIDTVLLATAIAMAVQLGIYPFTASWLTAKLIALLAYISLGMIALRWGRTRRVRIAAWIAAQCVFVYMVGVAITRSPVPI
jgi:uncharacterized membrane protein SirB2